ncbi:MAG: bifunctional hydroxymethylpyrimidine kinase/phosphomethylpyrimidine kinase [Nitrospirota bacterium]|nr:bifunctional hydroxymethylpyrimidine kinase/phosphomethylpyrimidine kinase [Nitrospirota bacterium]MDH5768265.1 bifunctional hydroxymethylpyrimidine kinase/phosphomethylpyrimidine kinase [Nitrospirota bacterium]
MKTALTIAGSDPTGGAGLQIDLKVFRALEVHGLSVISAITAQNTEGVYSVLPVEKNFFEKQITILLSDIRPDAIKIGMIYSSWAVEVVAKILKEYSLGNLVIDPVTVSSSGTSLVDNGTLNALKENLFPLSKLITPNIHEASMLTGIMIKDKKSMENTAKALKDMGPEAVVITGGHLEQTASDLYYDGELHTIECPKIEGEYHGTGCVFSAAVAAFLAHGYTPLESVRKAKDFVNNAIKKAYHPGKGMGLLYI